MGFFIKTVAESEATGELREFYEEDIRNMGFVPNTTRAFSLLPDTFQGWMALIRSIRKHMRLRNYELTTFAAALEMDCTYCKLAHGSLLRKNFFSAEQLEAIVADFHHAGLEEKEVLMMDYAQKVVGNAASTTQEDFDKMRQAGWTDEDILSITLAAAARSFASKIFDALGADADSIYKDLDEETHHALLGNRPFVV